MAYKDAIPWHVPNELKLFKRLTQHHLVAMGHKTFQSLPKGYLPDRINLVFSRSPYPSDLKKNIFFFTTLKEGFSFVKNTPSLYYVQKFVIGGEQIFQEFFKEGMIDKVIVSVIEGDFPGDTFFPFVYIEKWRKKVIHREETFITLEYQP